MQDFEFRLESNTGTTPLQVSVGSAVIWVNGPDGCILRICGVSKEREVSFDGSMVDVTIPLKATKSLSHNVKKVQNNA